MKGWVGTGAKNKHQQWQTAKQQLTNIEHVTQKNPWALRPQRCVRKHFPLISFLSQWKIQLGKFKTLCCLFSMINKRQTAFAQVFI